MSDFTKRIAYPTGDGVVILTACPCGLTVEQIAAKDVPPGVPFLIVDSTDIPADRTYRAAWRADFSTPDGHGMTPEEWQAAYAPPPPEPDQTVDPDAGKDRLYPRLPS